MRRVTSGSFALSASAALLLGGCDTNKPLQPSSDSDALGRVTKGQTTELVTLTKLPTLGSNSEALAVDDAGTVIVGQSFDRAGMLYAVKWTLQNGSWVIGKLPYAGSASATGVANQGDAAGYGATMPQHAVRWPAAGGTILLDCADDAGQSSARAISADGQVVAGSGAQMAAIWRVGGCRETLPTLDPAGYAGASAVNGDGTIVGGSASPTLSDATPIRWRMVDGQWQLEQLDTRPGGARGANGAGDLTGYVSVPCASANGCTDASVWYASGSSLDLAATVGGESSVAYDINAAGEVVGYTAVSGKATAYLWSPSSGTRQLVIRGSQTEARAVSDVRADGTRLVVGMANASQPVVWLVRNP